MLDPQKIWQTVLGELELMLSKANFTTWFKNTFVIDVDEKKKEAIIGVPNAFTQTWLEKRYNKYILKALNNVCKGSIKKIIYQIKNVEKVKKDVDTIVRAEPTSKQVNCSLGSEYGGAKNSATGFKLNPQYTFDNFIVGPGNQLAHSAGLAVVEELGNRYNPLFLYGDVGLGKTHLLHAIGLTAREKSPETNILCINFEQFTNDYVAAARSGTFDSFRQKYRSVDVLLVDDVQFMIDKEKTQDEFFHTFEVLHQNNKQIVITSDRPPKALVELQDRMISRFEWGMIADMKMPDLETRIAILQNKCQEKELELEKEIVQYMAENIKNSIRELEGALNKIIAWRDLRAQEPTLSSVKDILSNLMVDIAKSALSPKKVLKTVADFYNLSVEELIGSSRKKEIVKPRQVVMYILREDLNCSYPNIGSSLGDRDHTTVMYACRKIENLVNEEERLRQEIENIRQRFVR